MSVLNILKTLFKWWCQEMHKKLKAIKEKFKEESDIKILVRAI